jgi:xanthine/uracil/vitamin C permease (AzgA family)
MHRCRTDIQIKLATVVGMGLLLSLIGLSSAGVVVKNDDTMVSVLS